MPPPDWEILQVGDDGAFLMWRSVNSPVVGRFGGTLAPAVVDQLRAESAAAAATGDLAQMPPADSAIERIATDKAKASLGHPDEVGGPWGTFISHVRKLLDELTNSPVAAIGLQVAPNASSARLQHLGENPVLIDLSRLSVRAVLWGPGYDKLDDWRSEPTQRKSDEASGKWSFVLPFDHGFEVGKRQVVHVYCTFDLQEDAQRAPVSAVSLPPVPAS